MILAAGLGTRLKPLTDNLPKALVKIKNKTLLQIQLTKLKTYGITDVIINVHHFSRMIIDYLKENKNFGLNISVSDESDLLLDTGGGLKKAAYFFSDGNPFLIHNVDVISDINLNKLAVAHKNNNSAVSLAVRERKSGRYFIFDDNLILCGWENNITGEKKVVKEIEGNAKHLAFSGIQIIDPKIFDYFPDEQIFSLIDLYLRAAEKEKIAGFIDDSDFWIDAGKPENLIEAEKRLTN